MPNMSYCIFENTSNDLDECFDALEENNWDIVDMIKKASSQYEAQAIKTLLLQCVSIADNIDYEEIAELEPRDIRRKYT